MSVKKMWAVYDYDSGDRIAVGTKEKLAVILDMPTLPRNNAVYDGRVIDMKYLFKQAGTTQRPQIVPVTTVVLPPWANGSRKWYDKVSEVRSVLLMTRNCALSDNDKGEDYIEPLRAMGVNIRVREKKGKEIDGRGKVHYYDILEVV